MPTHSENELIERIRRACPSRPRKAFAGARLGIGDDAAVLRPRPGRELVITSNEMFDLNPFPKRLLVVGGGYIACEFASIFNGLGAKVTQIYRGEQVLRGFDADIRRFIADEVRKTGVDLQLGTDLSSLKKLGDGFDRDNGCPFHCVVGSRSYQILVFPNAPCST